MHGTVSIGVGTLVAVAVTGAAAAITRLAHRLATPAAPLLVVVGLAVGLIPAVRPFDVPPAVLTLGALPPLLFAAARELDLVELRTAWRPVATLALGLVAATAAAVAVVAHATAAALALGPAFVLGAVLASTDPVAVTALSRRLTLSRRLATVVLGESLANDATSLVLAQLSVLAVVSATGAGGLGIAVLRLAGLGAAIGAAAGGLARRSRGRLRVPVDVVVPFAVAALAYRLGASAVTAVIVAAVVAGEPPAATVAGPDRRLQHRLAGLVEAAVFALVGLVLAGAVRRLTGQQRAEAAELVPVLAAVLLLSRGVALALPLLGRRSRRTQDNGWRAAAIATWAGARGVIPLAAALSLPETARAGVAFPERALIIAVALGVVALTLVVQGPTLGPLVTRLAVADPPDR